MELCYNLDLIMDMVYNNQPVSIQTVLTSIKHCFLKDVVVLGNFSITIKNKKFTITHINTADLNSVIILDHSDIKANLPLEVFLQNIKSGKYGYNIHTYPDINAHKLHTHHTMNENSGN